MTRIGNQPTKTHRTTPQGPPSESAAVAPASLREPPDTAPPSRFTRARLQTYFLRQLERSGSVADAAARAGVAPRTVQRWRTANPAFARRYGEVLAQRVELLEDLAMRRACGTDRRAVFHRGKQVATVERHNDVMLMRVLARFDRLRERQAGRHRRWHEPLDEEALRRLDEAGERAAREAARRRQAAGDIEGRVRQEEEKRLSQLSPSMRQASDAAVGR
jgi:hypothetical protein